jgi:hypothetical protein
MMLEKFCLHCQKQQPFYKGIRGYCASCWREQMRLQRQCKGLVYNEKAKQKRLSKSFNANYL